jgi:plasmid stabilization system protein ParE
MVVVWIPGAEKRLRGIYSFYKKRAGEETATKIVSRIRERANALGRTSSRGHIELLLEDMPGELRSVVVKRIHKIIYMIEGEFVFIVSVFDCRQDPAKLRRSVIRTMGYFRKPVH